MKKFFTFLKVMLILSGLGVVIYVLFKDKIKAAIFNSKYEDVYLAIVDKAHLLGDLVQWPVDYVRALLP